MRSSSADERFVLLDGALAAAEADVDVAEHLDGAQRAGVELGGAAQVAQRGIELVLGVVNRAAFEVREHRIRVAGNGAAVGLDGLERALVGHGLVAVGDQAVEFPLVGQGGKGQGAGHTGHGHEQDGDDGATHGLK